MTHCDHGEAYYHPKFPNGRFADLAIRNPKDVHNCAYVDARNALIPEADRVASEDTTREVGPEFVVVGSKKVHDPKWAQAYSRHFMRHMDRLARAAHLVGQAK